MSDSSPPKNDNDGACDVKDDCEEDESGSSSSSSFVMVRGDDPELFETVRALVDDTDAAGRMREGEDDPSDASEEDDGDDDAAKGIGRVQLSNNSGANAGGGGGPEAGEEPHSEEVASFLAFTSTSNVAVARQYLEMSGHDLETAVGLFVDHGGIATATGGGGGTAAADEESCDASAATTPREDEGDDEGERGGGAGCEKLSGAAAVGVAAGALVRPDAARAVAAPAGTQIDDSPPHPPHFRSRFRRGGQWNRRHGMEAEIGTTSLLRTTVTAARNARATRRVEAEIGGGGRKLVLVGKILSTPTPTLRVSTSSSTYAPLHFMKVNVETWVIDLCWLPGWCIELPVVEDVEDVLKVGRRKVMVKAEPWGWPHGEPPATSTVGKTNDGQDCHRHQMEGFEIQLNLGWSMRVESLKKEFDGTLRNEFKNAKIYVTQEVLLGQRNWLI